MESAQSIFVFQIPFPQLKEPLDFLMNKHSPPRHVTFLGTKITSWWVICRPFEKDAGQIGSSPQSWGVKIKHI